MLVPSLYHNQEALGGHSLKHLTEPSADNGDHEENIFPAVDYCSAPPGRLNSRKRCA